MEKCAFVESVKYSSCKRLNESLMVTKKEGSGLGLSWKLDDIRLSIIAIWSHKAIICNDESNKIGRNILGIKHKILYLGSNKIEQL